MDPKVQLLDQNNRPIQGQEQQTPDGVEPYIKTNAGVFEMGSIFEAETVKGNKNYIVFMFVRDHHVYYCHGDRAKKVRSDRFQSLIDYGDLVPIPPGKVDPEKISLSVLGMMAMSNGLSFNDYLNVTFGLGEGSRV